MIFNKKYSKRELKEWCERYEKLALEATNKNLVNFIQIVEMRLQDLKNDVHAASVVYTGQKVDPIIRTDFKKVATNELLGKARAEIKSAAMELIAANYQYANAKYIEE